MARRRSVARFVRPPARTTLWIGAGGAIATIVSNSNNFLFTLNAAALALRPFTIIRSRIDVLFQTDQLAVSETPTGALGKVVVTEKAAAAGVASLPAPLAEVDADWFVYQGMSSSFMFASSVGLDGNGGMHYIIDSKAMRKVGNDDQVVTMFEARNAGGAIMNLEGRTLIKLH